MEESFHRLLDLIFNTDQLHWFYNEDDIIISNDYAKRNGFYIVYRWEFDDYAGTLPLIYELEKYMPLYDIDMQEFINSWAKKKDLVRMARNKHKNQ